MVGMIGILSSTLSDKDNLKFHLFPKFDPKGIPSELKNTSFPFKYGDLKGLKKIFNHHNIGIIKMEVCRNTKPDKKFLNEVRNFANKKNIILIFDECTTGFRESYGGLHMRINVKPDLVVFGKALGNGYPITAVVGKKEIMENEKKTFSSSTFWTDRIGPTAALKTLEIMHLTKSWEKIKQKGNFVMSAWKKLAQENNLNIKIFGIPSLARFEINSRNWLSYKNLITQELLKKKILATGTFYPSTKHTKNFINYYLRNLKNIFQLIEKCENGMDVKKLLENKISQNYFNRLN